MNQTAAESFILQQSAAPVSAEAQDNDKKNRSMSLHTSIMLQDRIVTMSVGLKLTWGIRANYQWPATIVED